MAAPAGRDKKKDASAFAIKNPATGHFITIDLRIVGAPKSALLMAMRLFDWEASPPASGLARAAPFANPKATVAKKPMFPDVCRAMSIPPKVRSDAAGRASYVPAGRDRP